MVVLSAAIVTTGKTLVARQFVEMTRLRVEGLTGAFRRLVDVGRDHTFIETETVRYVYQPMESLHLVLITNKSSNILEDLETLRLLAKIVQDCCQTRVSEDIVLKHALDIVFAFGEVISFGYRESVNLSQVKTYTEMDSHEEKLAIMQEQSKINEAREMAKKRQKELKQQRADAAIGKGPKGLQMGGFGPSGTPPTPSDRGGLMQEYTSASPGGRIFDTEPVPEVATWTPSMSVDAQTTVTIKAIPSKSMSLSKKSPAYLAGRGVSLFAPIDDVEEVQVPLATATGQLAESIKVEIKEKIIADLDVDGGLRGDVLCKGFFEVSVLDPAQAALVCFKLSPLRQDYKYRIHPNLNKESQAQNVLEVRPGVANFPSGGCMNWQMKTSDDNFLPVTLSCWPTPTSDGVEMVIELVLTDSSATLENVIVRFPASASSRPSITSASLGEATYKDGQVIWRIPLFDSSDCSGMLQFTASADSASMFPASFVAAQSSTRCPIDILGCYRQDSNDAIGFACEKNVTYELRIGA